MLKYKNTKKNIIFKEITSFLPNLFENTKKYSRILQNKQNNKRFYLKFDKKDSWGVMIRHNGVQVVR